MSTIINTKLGQHRGRKRLWLEGQKLTVEGIAPGQKLKLAIEGEKAVISAGGEGTFTVSKRTRNGVVTPVIDLSAQELADLFDGVEKLRVAVHKQQIVVSAHHQHNKVERRVSRLMAKVETGQPLSVASLFHGGGVLDKALHAGFAGGGVKTKLAMAVEMESAYLDSSLRNNSELWDDKSVAIESPIQDVDLSRHPPEVDMLCAGIPCTGASRSGRSKNGLACAEAHDEAGAMFFHFLRFVEVLNPAVVLIENVPEYQKTASMMVIRSVLASLGYDIQEQVLNGNDFGVLERRNRLCAVAVSKGLDGFDLESIKPARQKEAVLADIMDDVALDDSSWRSFDYLAKKEKRDKAAKKGFSRQLLDGDADSCGTIGRGYAKCRSTEPFIKHPEDPSLSRILTPTEHCRVKGIPESVIDGLSATKAHEVLGQSVIYPAFEAVGRALSQWMTSMCAVSNAA